MLPFFVNIFCIIFFSSGNYNNLHEKFQAARDIDEGKLVPIFLPKEIVSWFTERGIDYTQLTKDILESYRKAVH